jgi:ABC-type polar amino acid transport system ATPase subunit
MLRVSGLGKSFSGRCLFRDVEIAIVPGEAVAIMGASGTGKTTFLRCLNGLERADTGTVEVGGVRLDADEGAERFRAAALAIRRRVGFVFQGWHLFSHRTVLQNVMEGPVHVRQEPVAEAQERAIVLLEQVGVGHRASAWPHELSGGEQQRAAIARALAMRPEVLLLDEPTSALDEARAESLRDMLRLLVDEGLAILTVTHDAPFARRLATRVHRLENGRLEAAEAP